MGLIYGKKIKNYNLIFIIKINKVKKHIKSLFINNNIIYIFGK